MRRGGHCLKALKGIVIGIILGTLLHVWLFGFDMWKDTITNKWSEVTFGQAMINEPFSHGLPLNDINLQERDKAFEEEPNESIQNSQLKEIQTLNHKDETQLAIGMSSDELLESLGEPDRIDPSAYGYEWWVYNEEWQSYVQVGIKENQVVTLYTNGPHWEWKGVAPGDPQIEWAISIDDKQEHSFTYQIGFYTVELTADDLKERPVIIDDKTAIQLYIDIHDESLAGIRVMDLHTLLLHRPYALKYIGSLPEMEPLNSDDWEGIEEAYEQQVYDIVNVTRHKMNLPPFQWHETVSVVARGHSYDMLKNDYFDHYSQTYGDLGERLQRGGVSYRSAGENIAWNYVDAIDAHHGWLNSAGHRKNIVEESFTHLGVGIVEKYYTQNFVKK